MLYPEFLSRGVKIRVLPIFFPLTLFKMRSKTIHSMNSKIDFFESILELDDACDAIEDMLSLEQVTSRRAIRDREKEIESVLIDLGICLYETLNRSASFSAWFDLFSQSQTKTVPDGQTVILVRIIEIFKDPTGNICLTLDRIKLPNWIDSRYAFGLWHRRIFNDVPVFMPISWTDDPGTLESLKRFPGLLYGGKKNRDFEGFARTLYCSSQTEPLFD